MTTIDVAPTLIDAAGLQVPEVMTGKSIRPVIRDRRAQWRDDIFFQISKRKQAGHFELIGGSTA
ncbi:hypothetical protein JNB88_17800 [Rhizobium cauense]|uniref:sulfatase/phosphatase domain-containing protein n=1 Tax=Rhizobium cauense TaxID=1166683 RepID=UPI001C6E4073|nr:sulfatase/phosphatase domain-containing protein [Rhizobium cauense]MBW9115498.1 hypothetical protein [Rhizobium cauense]